MSIRLPGGRHAALPIVFIIIANLALVAASLASAGPRSLAFDTYVVSWAASQTALYAALAMTMRPGAQLVLPLLGIAGLTAGIAFLYGIEVIVAFLSLAAGSAAWTLPTRLGGKRFNRFTNAKQAIVLRQHHTLRQWFALIAVIAMWSVLVKLFPGSVSDKAFFVATTVAAWWGVLAMLQIQSASLAWPLLVTVVLVCGLAWMLVSGDAMATMNWTATNVHGDLAPISSPIEFVTTRLAHLQYFNMLEAALIWIGTLLAVELLILGWLRLTGYRIAYVEHDDPSTRLAQ